jgi:hypothetical protein
MYPNVFVSEEFFDQFDLEWANLPNSNIYDTNEEGENKVKSLNRIRDLMLSSNIYSDITDKSLVKYHTKQYGTYNNFKDLILHKAIKESNYKNGRNLAIRQEVKNCNKSGFCYFTNNDYAGCIEESKKTGKIILGDNFLKDPFFLQHTFGAESTNQTIFQIEKVKHPCNGIIIMDRYLFDDTNSQKTNKITNLISFLKELIPPELNKPFEIDILTENMSNNKLFDKKYDEILEAFPGKVSLHIYAPKKIEHDRYLITNYAIFSIALPFVGNTSVSCNFFPSNTSIEAIKNAHKIWRDKLSLALDIVKNTSDSIGLYKTIWKSDDIKHSIFIFE